MGTHMGLGGDTWASAIKTVSYCLKTTDSLMALSRCMDHGPQHGLRWVPHGTHISMAPRITKVRRNHQGIRHCHRQCPHGFQTSLHPGAAAWTTNTSMVSSCITDHGVFQGCLIQNVNLSSSQASSLPRARGIPWLRNLMACTFIVC